MLVHELGSGQASLVAGISCGMRMSVVPMHLARSLLGKAALKLARVVGSYPKMEDTRRSRCPNKAPLRHTGVRLERKG